MRKRIVVLGTAHQLQGDKFPGAINDPSYLDLIEQTIGGEKADFVFEEASGLGPTHAERLASSMLGPNRYLDVDPARADRQKHGLPEETGKSFPIDLLSCPDVARWEYPERHAKREEFWLQRIKDRDFESGIIICGDAHNLSFAFRLGANGFDVKCLCYMPHYKLCTKPHI